MQLTAILFVILAFWCVPAGATPIDVPIVINGPLPPPGTVACSGNHTEPGDVIATMTLVQPSPNVIFAIRGQDATRFVVHSSEVGVGATALNVGITYSLTVETIPSVDRRKLGMRGRHHDDVDIGRLDRGLIARD
jgi:hypothetical protein